MMYAHETPVFNAMWSIAMCNYANGTRNREMTYPTYVQLRLVKDMIHAFNLGPVELAIRQGIIFGKLYI